MTLVGIFNILIVAFIAISIHFALPKGYALADIIIDGYNLMGIFHKNLEKARRDLIQTINRYASAKHHNIVLVFDGWKEGGFEETRERWGKTSVIYSRIGVKADDVIKNILASSPVHWIVISSDREISAFAEKHGSSALRSDEFENKLCAAFSVNRRQEKDESADNDGYELVKHGKRGNPRKLSRKNKRKLDALNKL